MKLPHQWSFPFLISFSPGVINVPTCTNSAYWIGAFNGPDPREIKLPLDYTWHELMSLQIDREGQAISPNDLRAFSEIIPEVFQPFAPVAFLEAWSPIPFVCSRFGNPDISGLDDAGRTLAYWSNVKEFEPFKAACPMLKHFELILRVTQRHATKTDRGLLLLTAPGWSYKDDELKDAKSIHKIMKLGGYEVFTRTPEKS